MNPYKNVQVRFPESERQLLLDIESFEQILYLITIEITLITVEVMNAASNSFTNIKTASFFKDRSQLLNLFHIGHFLHPLPVYFSLPVTMRVDGDGLLETSQTSSR